jgi:NAD(P)-dependent dehydrogenase (short-subunit alcohol dehydrogenase family)
MKTAVITGASRGIGSATAEKFLSEGWKVIGTSVSGSGWQHDNLSWIKLDLLNQNSIAEAVELVQEDAPIDVLVDNAATYVDEEDVDDAPVTRANLTKILSANLIGTIDITEQIIKFLSPDGKVIIIGSRAGSLTVDKVGTANPSYRISKTALSMYTRLLAERLRDTNLTISIFDPGWVRTDMGGSDAERDVKEPAEEIFNLATSNVSSGKFWKEGKERAW